MTSKYTTIALSNITPDIFSLCQGNYREVGNNKILIFPPVK